MGRGISGLFHNTLGSKLNEDIQKVLHINGKISYSLKNLPGAKGIPIENRLNDTQISELTSMYGVEFAQIYVLGNGKNGRGGKYYLFSGDISSVVVPINKNIILINHTHTRGTAFPSKQDMKLMSLYTQSGSPQKSSSIVPLGKKSIRFTYKGVKK